MLGKDHGIPARTVRDMKDFTRKRSKIEFQIDDDVFEASPAIPADILTDFVVQFAGVENLPALKRVEALTEVLSMVLKPESFERFAARKKDRDNPIDLEQINDIIVWLMEQYGQRPTRPSQVSSSGQSSPEPGTSLTGTTLVGVSTFNP